ncbi:MAG: HisA/HisF family protein [Methanobrevibacter sp.]|jgi:phosphoribosylformimino-5-aminoimidazole carboxamide ribotide isomerase|nr:HisA/HisF family protein [Candidatus Methanovirga basalitermitum]
MLDIIPVMDLMNGIAVSGKSGNRDSYRSLKTVFSPSPNPYSIAKYLKINGANELYIADLDLIEKKGHNLDSIKMMNSMIPLILDAGIKKSDSFKFFLDFAYKIVVATETIESIEELHRIFDKFPKERIVVSVDIKNNELYSVNDFNLSLDEFKKELIAISPKEIILLDISRVGSEQGINNTLINKFHELKDKLILGGGIRKKDLIVVKNMGIKKILVGTGLHKGEIPLNKNKIF